MTDYISREAVLKVFGDIHPLDYNATAYAEKIKSIPAADVVERANANEAEFWKDQYICASEDQEQKHGKWIDRQFDGLNKSILYAIECSACNDVFTEVDPTEKPIKHNFCPQCGARMDL